jgi:hypothetical protein
MPSISLFGCLLIGSSRIRSSARAPCLFSIHQADTMIVLAALLCLSAASRTHAFIGPSGNGRSRGIILPFHQVASIPTASATTATTLFSSQSHSVNDYDDHSGRRAFLTVAAAGIGIATGAGITLIVPPPAANAVGPVKVDLIIKNYSAVICPPDRPIPGEKAMLGMRGLCVTCVAELAERAPKNLDKVGVYGFVTDGDTGDSVLANNPDLSTDAGQFAMVETVSTSDDTVTFEFIAAVPRERDLSKFTNGIGPLDFTSLRIISYPGGQQFGAIAPCEMNEFSDECEAWEAQNGPYKKGEYIMKSNPRTMGR